MSTSPSSHNTAKADFKPVNRKKPHLTEEEILRKREEAFFNTFQTSVKPIAIAGSTSWRSGTINGIYKPVSGKIIPMFTKIDNPSICLVFFNCTWYLKYGNRTMCKLKSDQPNMHCMPYEILTPGNVANSINNTSITSNASTINNGTNHLKLTTLNTDPVSISTAAKVIQITGMWHEKLGIFLPLYRERRTISCSLVNGVGTGQDNIISRNSTDTRRSISIASYSSRNNPHTSYRASSLNFGQDVNNDCGIEFASIIQFKSTVGESGLTPELYLRYVIVTIALLELDYNWIKHSAASNKFSKNTTNGTKTTTTADQKTELKTRLAEMKLNIERIRNIFYGLTYTQMSTQSNTRNNSTNYSMRPSVLGGMRASEMNYSGALHTETMTVASSVNSNASTINNQSTIGVGDSSGSVVERESIFNMPNNNNKQVAAVKPVSSATLLDISKTTAKQDLCNELQLLIIDADVYYTEMSIDFKNNVSTRDSIRADRNSEYILNENMLATVSLNNNSNNTNNASSTLPLVSSPQSATCRASVSGASSSSKTTGTNGSLLLNAVQHRANLIENCNDTLNQLKETLKLLLFSDVSLKADLIEWIAAAEGEEYTESIVDSDAGRLSAYY